MAEPVQGEGGFITSPPGYFQELISICRDNGILFIADEIQSGMGRTVKMFAIEHWGVEPDLVTVAKSLAVGMPLAAVVGKQVHQWGLGGTYSGDPVACAAALAVFEAFEEEDILGKARALGEKLGESFEGFKKKYKIIGSIRGPGAMPGLELVKGEKREPASNEAKKVASFCLERCLIILVCGTYSNVVRLPAPFVIADEQLGKGLSILEQGLRKFQNKLMTGPPHVRIETLLAEIYFLGLYVASVATDWGIARRLSGTTLS